MHNWVVDDDCKIISCDTITSRWFLVKVSKYLNIYVDSSIQIITVSYRDLDLTLNDEDDDDNMMR